jgi:hypothetical protein
MLIHKVRNSLLYDIYFRVQLACQSLQYNNITQQNSQVAIKFHGISLSLFNNLHHNSAQIHFLERSILNSFKKTFQSRFKIQQAWAIKIFSQ